MSLNQKPGKLICIKFEINISLGFVYRFAAVYGFGKPGKSAAAAAVTLTTQGEMCTSKTKKNLRVYVWE